MNALLRLILHKHGLSGTLTGVESSEAAGRHHYLEAGDVRRFVQPPGHNFFYADSVKV